jgi:tRNA(Met) cytidine acetyltransferase
MPNSLEISFNQVLNLAHEQHFRGCLVLSGSRAWCYQQALNTIALINDSSASKPLTHSPQICWVGDSVPDSDTIHAIPPSATAQLLGSDSDCLIIDAWSGLAPDMLGIASGTLRGGALFLLLTPPFEEWPAYDDPDYQRYTALRPNAYKMSGHFLQRAVSMFAMSEQASLADGKPWLSIVKQDDTVYSPVADALNKQETNDVIPVASASQTSERFIPSNEQLTVIHAVKQLSDQSTGIVLLNADRGRGKSVALGLAVKALLAQSHIRICIVASLRSQVNNLFSAVGIESDSAEVMFMAVDQFIADAAAFQQEPKAAIESANKQKASNSGQFICDLLIVDEAAAIPLPLLYQLVDLAPRSVFSSTLHGYEGSGRGFGLRFNDYLLKQDKPLQSLSLIEPIRWAGDDPLERFFNQLLILNADSRSEDQTNIKPSSMTARKCTVRKVNHAELLASESLLRSVFALLVDAHYQTRPSDLRQLLDVPYLHLWIAECSVSKSIVGVLLAYEEGGFAGSHDDLLEQIVTGKRRPQGNLLSQSLASHSADIQWCRVKSLRVTRIAVAESYRRQGVASNLLSSLESFALTEACDYWGSSFGFESRLLTFWQAHKALPVHLGLHRDKASGLRNLMIVKPLTETLAASTYAMHKQLLIDLPFWHAQFLTDISSDTLMLLSNGKPPVGLGGEDKSCVEGSVKDCVKGSVKDYDKSYDQVRIRRFIAGELTYEKVYPSLYRLLMSPKSVFSLAGVAAVEGVVGCPVAEASFQLAPNWAALAKQFQLKGRRDVIASIKTELIQLSMD